MNIENFDDLLHAARVQPEPQCLLLVFARVDLPENSSESERANFEAGQGGALVPTMSVDLPHARLAALDGFEALRAEADQHSTDWVMVLAGALGGRAGRAPDGATIRDALDRLVQRVSMGDLGGLIPFNRVGEALDLQAN